MTRELIELNWPAMDAFRSRKPIQFRLGAADQWHDYTGCDPAFDATDTEWRAKPEPREVWLNEYPTGLCLVFPSYKSQREADESAAPNRIRAVRFVEVVE